MGQAVDGAMSRAVTGIVVARCSCDGRLRVYESSATVWRYFYAVAGRSTDCSAASVSRGVEIFAESTTAAAGDTQRSLRVMNSSVIV